MLVDFPALKVPIDIRLLVKKIIEIAMRTVNSLGNHFERGLLLQLRHILTCIGFPVSRRLLMSCTKGWSIESN